MGKHGWILALAAITLAWAAVLQEPGPNQNAHLALVTAIVNDGSPRIDRYERWTRDDAYVGGHFYSAKAPGLALATVPYYAGLKAAGLVVHGPPHSVPWPMAEDLGMPKTAPWEVGLWGAALPFFLLLLLVRTVTEELVPGYGTIAAVTLGAGSLAGVFATLYFDHELSALLGFAAFALLFRDRSRHALAAGLVAGLAIDVEFPLAIIAVVLAVYARRRLPYLGGVLAGLVPLFAFNTWAGGAPWSLAYSHAVLEPGVTGHDVLGANSSGFFGLGLPSLHSLVELVSSAKGLVVMTPVWALAAFGLVLLWRAGRKAEAAVCLAVTGLFLAYDASYYLPFGGFNGGPRFLVPMLPFLAPGLAFAWRSLPGVTAPLALVSIGVTIVSILADPMLVSEDVGIMFDRIEHGGDQNGHLPQTVLHWVWGAHIAPLLLVGAIVATVVLATIPRTLTQRDLGIALCALLAWLVVYEAAPILIRVDGHWWPFAALVTTLAAWALYLVVRGRPLLALPALLLLPVGVPRFAGKPVAAAADITVAAVVLAVVAVRSRRAASPATP